MSRRLVLLAAAAASLVAAVPRAEARSFGDADAALARADANRDGVVTREEFLAQRAQRFDQLDRNHDGVLTTDDLRRIVRRRKQAVERFEAAVAQLDQNGDGRATRAEVAAGPAPLFDFADADHDGRLDKAEQAALAERAAARREAAR